VLDGGEEGRVGVLGRFFTFSGTSPSVATTRGEEGDFMHSTIAKKVRGTLVVGVSLVAVTSNAFAAGQALDTPDFSAAITDMGTNLSRSVATGIGVAGAIIAAVCFAYAAWKVSRKDHEGVWYLIGTAVGAAMFFVAKTFVQ
jgi:hypothetical protein